MKKFFFLLLICFGFLAVTCLSTQAAVYCFCNSLGCSPGDGVIIPNSKCDYVNGKSANGKTSIDDLIVDLGKFYNDSGVETPFWLVNPYDQGPQVLQRLLEKKENDLKLLKKKISQLENKGYNTIIEWKKAKTDHQKEVGLSFLFLTKKYDGLISDKEKEIERTYRRMDRDDKKFEAAYDDILKKEDQYNKNLSTREKQISDLKAQKKQFENQLKQESGNRKDLTKEGESIPLSKEEMKKYKADLAKLKAFKEKIKKAQTNLANDKAAIKTAEKKVEEIKDEIKSHNNKSDLKEALKQLQELIDIPIAQRHKIDEAAEKAQALDSKATQSSEEFFNNKVKYKKLLRTVEALRNELNKNKQHQTKIGMAPDANRYLNLKNISLSLGASNSFFKDDSGTTGSKGNNSSLNLGMDYRLTPNFSISPGLGFGRSDTDDDSGGGSKSNSYTGQLSFFLRPFKTPNAWLDGSLSYTKTKFDTQGVGSSGQLLREISYDSHSKSIGLGINGLYYLNDRVRLEHRLGWSGSFNSRDTYVDTVNITHVETDTQVHRVSLGGRLVRSIDWGQMSVMASLRGVAYDDSSANKDDRPLDANLGAGILFNINQSCSVSGKIGGIIGRKDYQEYNALLNLSFNF
ncbi:MAG: autotransporter domain-containing protein [Desulfobacula sp.]|nr:autotransporter domain-containing protein [Desulfobacula sp.]